MNKEQNTIRLLFGRHWKTVFDGYCKAVSNKSLIEKANSRLLKYRVAFYFSAFALLSLFFIYLGGLDIVLKAWTIYAMLLVFVLPFQIEKHLERINPVFNTEDAAVQVWIYRFFSVGLFGAAFVLIGLWGFLDKPLSTLDSLLLVGYLLLAFVIPNVMLNKIVPEKFAKPDHSLLLKTDDTLDIRMAPDPRPDGYFPLGIDADNEYMLWKFGESRFNSNLVITGQSHLYGKNLINTIIRGAIGAETDVAFIVYNPTGGLDFSWLRYDYRKLLGKKNIDTLYSEKWMAELASLPRLPNIVVVDEQDIVKSLDWLNEEYERRLIIRSNVPDAEFPTRIVVILDWGMTEKLSGHDNGVKVSALKNILRADRGLKMNAIAIVDPVETWQGFNSDLKPFASGLEFFHQAQSGGRKTEKGEDGKSGFAQRSFDIPALQYDCKLWWKGASKVISLLKCESKDLAEYVYKQAGNDKPETFALWKAACYFRPFQESETKKEILVNL